MKRNLHHLHKILTEILVRRQTKFEHWVRFIQVLSIENVTMEFYY